MKLFLIIIFLFSQSLVFGAGSSISVDANAQYLKEEKLVKTYKLDKAESYYLKALKLEHNHIGALEYLGELYYKTGRIDKASDLLERLRLVAGESS
mgnify:FL=1|tara:strand:- start:25 stop:312 length:288 start_codon:yes stop_codon:yes gene_type:complete